MTTYHFTEKNGNAVITLSQNSEEEAWDYLQQVILMRDPKKEYRLDSQEEEEELVECNTCGEIMSLTRDKRIYICSNPECTSYYEESDDEENE